jgi:hypothetical protein
MNDRPAGDGHQQGNFKGKFQTMATAYKWQFAPRFRRNAFGWKSAADALSRTTGDDARPGDAVARMGAAARVRPAGHRRPQAGVVRPADGAAAGRPGAH